MKFKLRHKATNKIYEIGTMGDAPLESVLKDGEIRCRTVSEFYQELAVYKYNNNNYYISEPITDFEVIE